LSRTDGSIERIRACQYRATSSGRVSASDGMREKAVRADGPSPAQTHFIARATLKRIVQKEANRDIRGSSVSPSRVRRLTSKVHIMRITNLRTQAAMWALNHKLVRGRERLGAAPSRIAAQRHRPLSGERSHPAGIADMFGPTQPQSGGPRVRLSAAPWSHRSPQS
jgi:hypothetical protein